MNASPPLRIRCCGASGCRSAGSEALQQALNLAAEQITATCGPGTAPQIKPVGCLRLCGLGPLVAVDRADGGSELYGGVPPQQAAVLLHPHREALASCAIEANHPFFALQQPVVLENCGRVDPESIDDAIARGYSART